MRLVALVGAVTLAIFAAVLLRVRSTESIARGVVAETQLEAGRDVWRVAVGGGRPPEIRLFTQHVPGSPPEDRLRELVADLLVELCGKAADPLVCVDELGAESVQRMRKQ